MMKNYRTLDAIVVVGSLIILAGGIAALVFLTIPQPNLPILSSLLSGSAGTFLGLYCGARWGNKKTDEPKSPGTVTATLETTPAEG